MLRHTRGINNISFPTETGANDADAEIPLKHGTRLNTRFASYLFAALNAPRVILIDPLSVQR